MMSLLLQYPMKPATCKLTLTFGVENSMEAKNKGKYNNCERLTTRAS